MQPLLLRSRVSAAQLRRYSMKLSTFTSYVPLHRLGHLARSYMRASSYKTTSLVARAGSSLRVSTSSPFPSDFLWIPQRMHICGNSGTSSALVHTISWDYTSLLFPPPTTLTSVPVEHPPTTFPFQIRQIILLRLPRCSLFRAVQMRAP
jgi:hypothetical protein